MSLNARTMAFRRNRRDAVNNRGPSQQPHQPQETPLSTSRASNKPSRSQSLLDQSNGEMKSDSVPTPMRQQQSQPQQAPQRKTKLPESPSLEPYFGKLERFELFSTNQCYYLIGCDKLNTTYRILKMDRTLIEGPPDDLMMPSTTATTTTATTINTPPRNRSQQSSPDRSHHSSLPNQSDNAQQQQQALEGTHNSKPTLRPLSEFLTEDPHIYSQEEIADLLDTIHEGNRLMRADHHSTTRSTTASPEGNANGQGVNHTGSSGGGLKPIVRAYGIVGFVRFLDCYYLTLITRRAKVGNIGGNAMFTIKDTETFPLKPAVRTQVLSSDPDYHTDPSSMLLSMWNRGKRSVGLGLTNREIAELRYQGLYQVVDLTKNFFFSYTYDLTRSLQENFLASASQPFPPPPFKDMYAWNFFLTREFEACTSTLTSHFWIMPIIHGAYVQRKIFDYGRSLNIILIARRSRHFAGTRYLKRGVSEQGKVANDVEHEQILHDESVSSAGNFASYLQMRGSIPIFWSQESSVTVPKPPIELNRVDPTYRSTQWHFEDMMKRYGSPVVVLDLVKQSEKREREVRVGDEFRHAIEYINTSIDDVHKIRYCALDYSHISKHRNLDVSTTLNEVSTWAVNLTGFFCSQPKWKLMEGGSVEPFDENDARGARFLTEHLGVPVFPMEQKGVLRTNCIDCLDRTNVAQFSAGVEALEQQLVVMGIRSSANLDPSSTIVRSLIDMYVEIGDFIALQYGGSEAHKKVSTERSESNIAGPMGKHKELLTSIRRYYSNTFTDRLKQDAMNLFLGYYVPYRHTIPLWEMENDYYLHNFHVKAGRGTFHSMRTYQRQFGIEWIDDEYQDNESQKGNPAVAGSPSAFTNRRKISRPGRGGANAPAAQESHRIARLRRQCESQNQALSVWWKAAIQNHIQQRMWMQLGRGPSESMLPPRYERIYQPDKLTQFDRLFARSWVTPVRRTHTAQHSSVSDDGTDLTEYRRTVNRTNSSPLKNKKIGHEQQHDSPAEEEVPTPQSTLEHFASNFGFEPQVAPTLRNFLKPFKVDDEKKSEEREESTAGSKLRPYVGRLEHLENTIPDEYVRYAQSMDHSSSTNRFRPDALREFSGCLHDYSLNSDDVGGIRMLAESAHIGRRITSGPYRGLSTGESAVEIATIAHEQLNALSNMRNRGEIRDAFPMVETELRRRGVYSPGVKHEVEAAWTSYSKAEKVYSEIFQPPALSCRRSDLTTADSLRLYASFFDDDTQLMSPHQDFLLGGKSSPPPPSSRDPAVSSSSRPASSEVKDTTSTTSFVKKAARVGIQIPSYEEISKSKAQPLFPVESRKRIPSGFEQINEDLFARKDNKFVVFNGAGIDSWTGSKPVTKLSSMEEDFLLSLIR